MVVLQKELGRCCCTVETFDVSMSRPKAKGQAQETWSLDNSPRAIKTQTNTIIEIGAKLAL